MGSTSKSPLNGKYTGLPMDLGYPINFCDTPITHIPTYCTVGSFLVQAWVFSLEDGSPALSLISVCLLTLRIGGKFASLWYFRNTFLLAVSTDVWAGTTRAGKIVFFFSGCTRRFLAQNFYTSCGTFVIARENQIALVVGILASPDFNNPISLGPRRFLVDPRHGKTATSFLGACLYVRQLGDPRTD